MEILGERLKELRESVGMSQAKLGKLIDLPQSCIFRYEHGLTTPSAENLLWYADYFDVSMDYIFGRTDNPGGKTYKGKTKSVHDAEALVEMCFNPESKASARLKAYMIKMLTEEDKENTDSE